MKTCKTCRYWIKTGGENKGYQSCTRYPPTRNSDRDCRWCEYMEVTHAHTFGEMIACGEHEPCTRIDSEATVPRRRDNTPEEIERDTRPFIPAT